MSESAKSVATEAERMAGWAATYYRLLVQARELLESVDDWGHPGTHNSYMEDVDRWLAEAEPLLNDGPEAPDA